MRELKNKTVAVMGMGRSGLAAIELLLRQGARVIAVDQRGEAELDETPAKLSAWGVPLRPQRAESFAGADLVVLSPGVPADLAEIRGLDAIGELELAAPFLRGHTIGITGSNGKTTTTALTGHILRESGIACQVGGNIGTAPAAMIDSSRTDQWNVLELSSFQLETIQTFRADIGVVLNVTPNHLDRHKTLEAYANAKARLVETQTAGDFAVLNAGNAVAAGFAGRTRARVVPFNTAVPASEGAYRDDESVYLNGEPFLAVTDIPLRGSHNVENVMAAACAAYLAGAAPSRIAAAVKTFPGVEHRLEFVREINGVAWYNDSKATSVDATQKALDTFDGRLWVILGGKDKGSDYRTLAPALRKKARGVLLIGAAAGIISGQLKGEGLSLIPAATLQAAVQIAAQLATHGDTVLLAPACASFDQFRSFEHRGDVFKRLVFDLTGV